MNCPKCGHDVVSCIDSRPRNGTIYRRRKCMECGHRFSTLEISLDDMDRLKHKEALLRSLLDYVGDIEMKLLERETK